MFNVLKNHYLCHVRWLISVCALTGFQGSVTWSMWKLIGKVWRATCPYVPLCCLLIFCSFDCYLTYRRGAKYCDEHVCLSVCLHAYLSACIPQKPRIETWNFLTVLIVAVARSCSVTVQCVMWFQFCGWSHVCRYIRNAGSGGKVWCILLSCLPAALRTAQICRYLVYSEADFEVFRPAWATRCTDGGEIWRGGRDRRSLLHAKFHLHRCNDKGVGPPKLKFLLRFDRNLEYKRPAGAYPLCNFHKIYRVCTPFQDTLALKISLDLLKGLWCYGGFKFRGSGCPQIFSAP